MTLTSLGRVNVATPGTPVALASNPSIRVCRVLIQAIPGLTGKGYLGTPLMTKATLSGVTRVLAPNPGGGVSDSYEVRTEDGRDGITLSQLAIDMDVAGEGMLVSYWVE